jgi:hypothetical protein
MARISRDAIEVILPHRQMTELLQNQIKSDDIILSAMAMQVVTHLLKQLAANRRKIEYIEID